MIRHRTAERDVTSGPTGRNLSRIDFPEVQQLTDKLQQIDRLMGQAQGIDFRIVNGEETIMNLCAEAIVR